MRYKRDLFLCITCLFLAFLLTMADGRQNSEAMAARIAPEILRFHVLANSDTKEDQQLKLKVRTLLLDSIYEGLGENASLDATKEYVLTNKYSLEREAEDYMKTQGYEYPAHIELARCYFPTKTYGDMVFPCGTYDAVRVELGSGKGSNWWCVLYPPLCFVDSTYAVVPDSSREILRESLEAADYRALVKKQPQVKVRIRSRLWKTVKQMAWKTAKQTGEAAIDPAVKAAN